MLPRITVHDLPLATPNPGWDVADVINHAIAVTRKFTSFAVAATDRPHTPTGTSWGPVIGRPSTTPRTRRWRPGAEPTSIGCVIFRSGPFPQSWRRASTCSTCWRTAGTFTRPQARRLPGCPPRGRPDWTQLSASSDTTGTPATTLPTPGATVQLRLLSYLGRGQVETRNCKRSISSRRGSKPEWSCPSMPTSRSVGRWQTARDVRCWWWTRPVRG